MKISVGIPVYNGEKFIKKSVQSAVDLKEVAEIIIVDDGSTDNTYQICCELEEKHSKIRLLQHPGGVNKGLPASRNLAVCEAVFDYVAFLDADDLYLAHRFEKTLKIIEQYPDLDGVYEPMGTYYYDEDEKERFLNYMGAQIDKEANVVTKIIKLLKPDDVFHHLLMRDAGTMNCPSLTLKKNLFKRSGYFNEKLKLHGDDEAFLRFAYHGKLYPGETEKPVAIRGVHKGNRWTKQTRHTQYLRWKASYRYFANRVNNKKQARVLLMNAAGYHPLKSKRNKLLKYGSYFPVFSHLFLINPIGFLNVLRLILR